MIILAPLLITSVLLSKDSIIEGALMVKSMKYGDVKVTTNLFINYLLKHFIQGKHNLGF